jgi:hypothetical protein
MDYNEVLYKVITIEIVLANTKFQIREEPVFVKVSQGSTIIKPIMTSLSGNKKSLIGYFTTDAFDLLTANADILFGYDSGYDIIPSVDIQGSKLPLFSLLNNASFLIADNLWLSTL